MGRPKLPRKTCCHPACTCYRPEGGKVRNQDSLVLEKDELEAVSLYDVDNLDQKAAARKMRVSQPTFARILKSAHQKVSRALVKGKRITFRS